MQTGICRGCGREIVYALDPQGQTIPLDPRPAVYQLVDDPAGPRCERIRPSTNAAGRMVAAVVTHFATCPKASQFSGRGKVTGG